VIRVSYFYAVIPVVLVVATAVLLTIPYLALVVFFGVIAGGLVGLARAARMLVRAVGRLRPGASTADPEQAPVLLSPVTSQRRSTSRIG